MKYGEWQKEPDTFQSWEGESGLARLYRKIWQKFPGRPWTYVVRDWWHQYPLLWILGVGSGALVLGLVLAHLFW